VGIRVYEKVSVTIKSRVYNISNTPGSYTTEQNSSFKFSRPIPE
jgi:hypothetical protein